MDTEDKYHDYANLPIPSYEEATSSRPTSSQNYRGAEEISDDAERQGLLDDGGNYRPPTVESPRSSLDSDLRLPEVTVDDDRRQIEELDYLDPSSGDASDRRRGVYHRARLRSQLSKHLANISATFSSLRLPSFRSFYSPVATAESTDDSERPASPPRRGFMFAFPTIPDEYRMTAPTFARLCALGTIGAMIYLLFAFDMFPGRRNHMGSHFDPESVRQFVQENADGDSIARYLHHITSYDHVAGTEGDLYLAKWMQERWVEWDGFDAVELQQYDVYLDYPRKDGRSVTIVEPAGKKWTAKLEEGQVDQDKVQTWAWHGHSFSGEAKGHLIYANGGSREDFKWLKDHDVETKGAIALVRTYAGQNDLGLKVKAAEDAGCAGVLIYSDPNIDGARKGNVWPDGPWRPEDSIQRGAVSYTNWILGDPLTPGRASKAKGKHQDIKGNPGLPSVPSLPLAWRDAKVLIDALKGQGVKVPSQWVGEKGKKANWYSGAKNGNGAPVVELRNHNDNEKTQSIWNLHGLIQGIESPEKKVMVGNHRDSWCFGSVDPGSGSAIMMEVVSIFLALRTLGWRPLRTIEFSSWDAGAYNLIGSTEYVENNIGYLRSNGVAYLNIDAGVYGENLRANGSPVLKKPLMRVLNRVSDPLRNQTLRQLWEQEDSSLSPLGADGDYAPFQMMAGTSSIDLSFQSTQPHAFPAHSCYETFEWMQKFGDPGFHHHRTLAQVWALLILEMADRPVIPFNLKHYSNAIHLHIRRLQQDALSTWPNLNNNADRDETPKHLSQLTHRFNLQSLKHAADKLTAHIEAFTKFEDLWSSNVLGAGGLESASFAIQRLQYNDRMAHFESDLLDLPYAHNDKSSHGIPGREQFKHVVFAPQAWGESNVFGGIRDAMEEGKWKEAQEMVERAAKVIERAGERLNGG